MDNAWQILRDGGLPLAIEGAGGRPTADAMAAAIKVVIGSAPVGREAEALAAFIFAWLHEWPRAFSIAMGLEADRTVEWAQRHIVDDGRYLKLRRIAIENLASMI